ncbi:MAG TPA: acetate/propionate family kinase, partial [Acidobacteriota bacterium]|nr:acetate/propionate family kinase [Acidobacteriota bacterium]
MKILVCNLGSTSFKFQVLDMPVEHRLARGTFEKIGSGPGRARFWRGDRLVEDGSARLEDHPQAVELAIEWLRHDAETDPLTQVSAVAFKCVQG